MAKKTSVKIGDEKTTTIVVSVVLLIVGILFCCSLAMAVNAVSIVIGVGIIVLGLGLLCSSFLGTKSFIGGGAIAGGAMVAFGVMFIVDTLAWVIFGYIPYFLIALGALFIFEAIRIIVANKKKIADFAICLSIGVVAVVLGVLLLCVDGFADYAALVFGIILIIYAVYVLVRTLVKKK